MVENNPGILQLGENVPKNLGQVLQSDLIWTHKWSLRGLSDLHLGNQKVTLKKLGYINYELIPKPHGHDLWAIYSDLTAEVTPNGGEK